MPACPSVQTLREGALAVGAPLSDAQAETLLRYVDIVLEVNQQVNLTGVRERGDAVVRHLLDSLSVVRVWHDLNGPAAPLRVLDLGTGGGFPGAVLAVVWPAARFLLVDGTGKKVRAVEACLRAAGIGNAEAFQSRGVDLAKARPDDRRAFDLCVARAVGSADRLLRELHGLCAPGGSVLLMKGPEVPAEEVAAAARVAPLLSFAPETPRHTRVPGLERRTVLVYRARA